MAVQLTPQRKLLAVAASQIGYSRWSDSQRGTKYARETQPVFWPRDAWLLANGISYCDLFVTWVFWKAFGEDFVRNHLPGGASYNTDYRASKGGRVSKSEAAPGDILVFDWNWATASTNHVGILEKRLSGERFQTIEGNTSVGSSGSQSNGGRVARRVRRHDQVRYVLRPDWSKVGGSSESVADRAKPWNSSKTIASLSKADVKGIQARLADLGYDLGSYGVDGSYGRATYDAVGAFQTGGQLCVDGVGGPDTRKALSGAQAAPAKRPALKVDGKLGAATAKRIQTWLGVKADGVIGPETIRAWQKAHGTPVDGKITGQGTAARPACPAIRRDCLLEGSGGSKLIRKVQIATGLKGKDADGKLGPKTVRSLQTHYNRLG